LMLQPADLLLLDEPTNDLDIPTLETLEDSLVDFPGAVILITHDRCMLNRICNSLLALGDPEQNQLFPDFAQWEASIKSAAIAQKSKEKKAEASPKGKLTYGEKKELEQIEGKIGELEAELQKLNHSLESSEVAQNPDQLQLICSQVALIENRIQQAYLRWEELEKKLRG